MGTTDIRVKALQRFAIAISILNILGHSLLGFEQAVAHVGVALGTAYSVELLLEYIDARVNGRRARFLGGFNTLVTFLLSAHITGLACSMLLYPNERMWPIAFAVTVAIGSKAIFRVVIGNKLRHFLNPSNTGISATLLAFPSVGIVPPYHFTENISGVWDWALPAVIIASGSLLNIKLTGRAPLIAAWLGTFVFQAMVRVLLFDAPPSAVMAPMTGMAFLLFTFYMVSDPGTTPSSLKGQIGFGVSVGLVYGMLLTVHVVFTLFFSLTLVCVTRGVLHYVASLRASAAREAAAPPVIVTDTGAQPQ